ncbi:MAG TPA: FAD-binding oxidoreductase [Gemmatimonadota bacterium]|nr:FAD-binding oxidoreductase [Gemmatimonadota bacterium]
MSRERSFWGWGWADKFPDDAGRKGLGDMAAAFLGGAPFEVRPAPSLAGVRIPAPKIAIPDALSAVASAELRERATHTYGKGFRDLARGFAGDFSAAPDFVARPRDEDEVDRVMEWCAKEQVACIPFGGGSSVVGGVEAAIGRGYRGAVSLDLGMLDRVLEVDHVSRAARIQGGVLGPALERQLGASGLTLRHFPQSFEFSSLGGWIATRAGGHFATLYTHIDDLVESVRMRTPRGVWESRRLPASGAGPSPDRLVLGSEGILGVITEAWMRVQPKPKWRAGASVLFAEYGKAVDAVRELSQSGLHPANCRLLDAREAMLNGVSQDNQNVLVLGFESADHPLDAWITRALAITASHGGACPAGPKLTSTGKRDQSDEAGSWKQAFLEAPYLFNTLVSLGFVVDTFETACTWDRFPALHAAVVKGMKDAMKRICGKGLITCRFTHVYPDGPAPYFTFLAPSTHASQLAQWSELKAAASELLVSNGATITHHHAVGRLHRPGYDKERPPLFAEALRAAKKTLDPSSILNPGVLIDP